MFIIKGAKNREGQRAKDWINAAIGETDNYGNPFEIIELSWKRSMVQRMAEYAKTRGFEDTEISDSKEGVIVTHIRRGNGCIMWERPFNGRGPFVGRLAKTPFNMVKLAKCYRDNLWTIKNKTIDYEVRAMSDKLWEEMTPQQRKFNEERIRRLHVLKSELDMQLEQGEVIKRLGGDEKAMQAEYEPKKVVDDTADEFLTEEKKALFRKEKELEEREMRIKELEEQLLQKRTEEIRQGNLPVKDNSEDTADQLRSMRPTELRRLARVKYGITLKPSEGREVALQKILEKQRAKSEEPELVTG